MNKNMGKALIPFGKSILGTIVKINPTAHEPTLLRMNQHYCASARRISQKSSLSSFQHTVLFIRSHARCTRPRRLEREFSYEFQEVCFLLLMVHWLQHRCYNVEHNMLIYVGRLADIAVYNLGFSQKLYVNNSGSFT